MPRPQPFTRRASRSGLTRTLLTLALALAAAASLAPAAWAHSVLERSAPADNAVVADPPPEVRLWFTEAIVPKFSSAQVSDVEGRPVAASVRVDSAGRLLTLALPELEPGLYSVSWKVLSAVDGHFRRGLVVFGVGTAALPSAGPVAQPENPLEPVEIVLRWLNFSFLAALAGGLAVAQLVLAPLAGARRGAAVARARRLRRRVLAWTAACAVLSLLVGAGLLLWQVAAVAGELSGDASPLSVGLQLLGETRWGALWIAREAILVPLVAALVVLLRTASGDREAGMRARPPEDAVVAAAGLLVLALVSVQALTGHAAAVAPSTALAVVAAALHLLAAAVWVGGLLALVVGLWPLLRRWGPESAALARACLGPFSRLAALSVGLLAATGLYYAGREVASLDALVTTLYGRVLLGKVGLVLLVAAFGLANSVLLHPRFAAPVARRLGRPPGWTPLSAGRIRPLVLAEVGLGVLVIAAAAVITASAPPRGPEFAPRTGSVRSSASGTVDDLVVSLSVKPNHPGENVFSVLAASSRRPPPAEIEEVALRFSNPDSGAVIVSPPMQEVESARYRLGGDYLSVPGGWRIDVIVRRGGLADRVAGLEWEVPQAGGRAVVISDRPLEPLLTRAAGAVLLALLAAILLMTLRRLPRRPGENGSPETGLPLERGAG